MRERSHEKLRVLIANEGEERIQRVRRIVAALGHEVIVTSTDVGAVAALTAAARPDVALIGLGDDSAHGNQISEQQAFDILRDHARRSGRTLVDVAQALCDSHTLLPAPDRASDGR
jgi:AmiR/NasT family two-component response regulator